MSGDRNRDPTTGPGHWFEEVAEHLGEAYLRYSFTYGTVQEVDFLVEALDLDDGARILDIGCGPGRHSHELARLQLSKSLKFHFPGLGGDRNFKN